MFAVDDTIVAIATPPGRGGIGVVRVSGPLAFPVSMALCAIEAPFAPRHATVTRLRPAVVGIGDQVVATAFPGPASFTGQDVVEISAHGSPVVLDGIVRAAIEAGCRLAQPGEFTLRAYLGGKIDLVQAEAIGDIARAVTPAQARVACEQLSGGLSRRIEALHARLFDMVARIEASLDFPEEGFHFVTPAELAGEVGSVVSELDRLLADGARGRVMREGATVVLTGRPNVGKSTLFNTLLGRDRAIVTPVAGTTRDMITDQVDLGGVPVTLVDTAGVRRTDDPVEGEGVRRALAAGSEADLVLVLLDSTQALDEDDHRLLEDTAGRPRLVVGTKSDLTSLGTPGVWEIATSGSTGEGIAALREAIGAALGAGTRAEPPAVSNQRHLALLRRARGHLIEAGHALEGESLPEEFVLTHLHDARHQFDEVVGRRTSEDILAHIFATFCIGK